MVLRVVPRSSASLLHGTDSSQTRHHQHHQHHHQNEIGREGFLEIQNLGPPFSFQYSTFPLQELPATCPLDGQQGRQSAPAGPQSPSRKRSATRNLVRVNRTSRQSIFWIRMNASGVGKVQRSKQILVDIDSVMIAAYCRCLDCQRGDSPCLECGIIRFPSACAARHCKLCHCGQRRCDQSYAQHTGLLRSRRA